MSVTRSFRITIATLAAVIVVASSLSPVLAANFSAPQRQAPNLVTPLVLALSLTIVCSCAALQLIARRMRQEMARRAKAETTAGMILESVGEGVLGVNESGAINFVNATAVSLLGYDGAEELLGKDARATLHHNSPGCDSCKRNDCRIYPPFSGDDSSHRADSEILWRRDGSTFSADFSCTPVWNGDQLSGAVMTFRDVSEQRETQERLRLQSAALEAAVNSIMIADRDQNIIWVNHAFTQQTGYRRKEGSCRTLFELLSGRQGEDQFQQASRTIGRKLPWHGELVMYRRDGSCYDAEVTITPVLEEEGEITHFIALMKDITERKRAREELLQSNQALEEANSRLVQAIERANELALKAERANDAKSEFLANMSHEIRTPMNAIIGISHLLRDTRLDGQQAQYLQTLTLSAESLLGIINDILDFSKIEAGKLEIDRISFAPDQVLSDVVAVFAAHVEEKGLALRTDLDCAIPGWLQGDPLRLTQILNNLLGNAVKFTSKGEITLSVQVASRLGDTVELEFSVRDTGIGMRPEDQAQLFQAFTQVDGSITRNYGGTGLGLAICKQLTTLMGGRIWCDSKPGSGSTFTFRLPFAITAGATAEMRPAPTGSAANRFNGESVLLVEDNPFNQHVAVALLKKVGLSVTVANNGAEALEQIREYDFDVVLMDIQMPGMDGHTTARQIRKLAKPGVATLPILAVSANAMDNDVKQSRAAGMAGHVRKPYTPEALYDAIAECLRKKEGPKRTGTLDTEVGMKQTGGCPDLYRELLARFYKDFQTRAGEIRREVQEGNLVRASRMAHAVKGVVGFIGAMPAYSAAQRLEVALEQGSLDVGALMDEFEEELTVTLDQVRAELRRTCTAGGRPAEETAGSGETAASG